MNKNDIYKIARSQVKPQKVVSYNPKTDKALLPCGHERYAPRHGIAPKKLLCAQCISIKIEAVEHTLAPDAACAECKELPPCHKVTCKSAGF